MIPYSRLFRQLTHSFCERAKYLYDRYQDNGLFEQNFRYFIKNKKIDDNINASLDKKREKFWFLNNGIIIGCNDFDYDNDNVKLYKFSIINGCQTTTLIGEYDGLAEADDFVLPCKIVKPDEGLKEEEFLKFISEIAESSNSQKPISDRDLKSNMPEQRNLQDKLKKSDPKIYLEIKRGEERRRNIESWQIISNDIYGQLVLSFYLQQPGTARSFKKRIFGDEHVYCKIFKRTCDKDSIVDLLKLFDKYQQYLKHQLENETFDTNMENVATNGKLAIISVIGLLIKIKRRLIRTDQVLNDKWVKELQEDNLRGNLFVKIMPDTYENVLQSLFVEIITELTDVYVKNESTYKTVSNLFKSDKYYNDHIIPHIINRYVNNKVKQKEIISYLDQLFICTVMVFT